MRWGLVSMMWGLVRWGMRWGLVISEHEVGLSDHEVGLSDHEVGLS